MKGVSKWEGNLGTKKINSNFQFRNTFFSKFDFITMISCTAFKCNVNYDFHNKNS